MKTLITFLFFILTTGAFGQNVPHSAQRIVVAFPRQIAFNNVPAPTGLNTGCVNITSNCSWVFFTACDSNIVNIVFAPSSLDTIGAVVYGPFQDTINLNNQILNSVPILCTPSVSLINPFFGTNKFAKGIYYILLSSRRSQPSLNMHFNYFPAVSDDPNMCRICNGVADLQGKMCAIDLDTATQRNKLIWEKNDTTNISGYVIFRENSIANKFDSIDFVPLTSLSEYIDMSANPAARAWRYRIHKMDNCGHIPDSAEFVTNFLFQYTTLFLQQGVSGITSINLLWNSNSLLGDGNWMPTYYIYRGSSPSNLTLIDSLPSQMSQYSDVAPLPGINYYQIERRKILGCTSNMLPNYTKAGSNLIGTLFVGIPDVLPETTFSIFPNPVTDHFTLQLHPSAQSHQNEFHLFAGDGKLIGSYEAAELLQKAGESLVSGVYTIQLINAKGTSNKRFVKL